MSRYLILSSIFVPENAANAVRIKGVVDKLLSLGHEVDVVCAFPYYQNTPRDRKYRGKLFFREHYKGARVLRCFVPEGLSKAKWARLVTFFSYMILSVVGALFYLKGPYKSLLCISPPFFSSLSAWFLGLVFKVPTYLDIQDLYPDTALHLGILKKGILFSFLKGLEKFIYKGTKGILVISPGFKKFIVQMGITADKIHHLPSWIDFPLEKLRNMDKWDLKPSFQKNLRKKQVLFSGNMGLAQDLLSLKRGFLDFKNREDLQFLFVGDGVQKETLLEFFKTEGMNNVHFTGSIPHEEVLSYLAQATVALVHLVKNPLYEITIPCKTYEYFGSGTPILMGVAGEALTLIKELKVGIGFEPQNPKDFSEKLSTLLDSEEERKEMEYNGRRALESYHCDYLVERYAQLIQ